MISKEVLEKYSVPAPRYTSYPPANFFNEEFTADKYLLAIEESNDQQPEHISVYIHFPFCFQICHYCGCNAWKTPNRESVKQYMDALRKEIAMVLPLLSKDRKIAQIHYGGGSPSSLSIAELKELNELILSQFEYIENPEIAIECHPGFLNEGFWNSLSDAHFNRVSLGVQDFDDKVLEGVNRRPSRMPVENIVQLLREQGISINMDFIYGLPLQTLEGFTKTIDRAIRMKPDRIVTFSYGHVPSAFPQQKQLEIIGLPEPKAKSQLFEMAIKQLKAGGYELLGLDHFVLPSDELYLAKEKCELKRNFQGYCTLRTTGQVYAFGVTAISQLSNAYCQNTKSIEGYIDSINKGQLPVLRGYLLNEQEQIARAVITELMCNYAITWSAIAKELGKTVDEVKSAMNIDQAKLDEFARDGIIKLTTDRVEMLPDATPFVRNVAASLDKLLINSDKQFSRV